MYDFEIEKNLLGALLNDNDRYNDICNIVSVNDFSLSVNRELYSAISKAVLKGDIISISTLVHEEKFRDKLKDIVSYTNAPSSNAVFYAKKLQEIVLKQKLKQVAENINGVVDSNGDIEGLIESLNMKLSEIVLQKSEHNPESFDVILMRAIQSIQKAYEVGGITGLQTGYPNLDKITGGLNPQEITIIGARPGVGKTYFGLNMAKTIAQNKTPCAYFILEMNNEMMGKRILSMTSNVSISRMREGDLHEIDISAIGDAASKLYELPLYCFDMPNAPIEIIKSKARFLKRKHNIGVLFIDYLGIIGTSGRGERWEKMGDVSAQLKGLARELNIPIVAMSQLSRDAQDKPPNLAQIRDSGSIEQDADVVLFLHRIVTECSGQLIIAKNRHGFCATIELEMSKKTGIYREKHNQPGIE